jgi:dynein heavy chain
MPHVEEEKVVLMALNNINLPKFIQSDIQLFQGITSDLFPNVSIE